MEVQIPFGWKVLAAAPTGDPFVGDLVAVVLVGVSVEHQLIGQGFVAVATFDPEEPKIISIIQISLVVY